MSELQNRRTFFKSLGLSLSALALTSSAKAQEDSGELSKIKSSRKFSNKVVLITGATSGIGRATAIEFAKQGALVVFNGRRERLGKAVVAEIENFGGEAHYIRTDVRQEKEISAFFESTIKKFGKIDIAFNNAGIGQEPGDIATTSTDVYEDIMKTNLAGVFHCMRHEIEQFKKQGYGCLINMSSIIGDRGFSDFGAYAASKGGVDQLTKSAALTHGTENIRINAIAPGFISKTDIARNFKNSISKDLIKKIQNSHVLKRLGTPKEVANVVLFLASAEASFIHGQIVKVDGYFARG